VTSGSGRTRAIRELFDAALNEPVEQRQAFLLASAPDDPALRAEVAALLAAHEDPADLFSRPLAEQMGLALPAASSLVGRELGPYRVTRELGRGGMGTVYEAVRADAQFSKRVAIKTLRGETDSAAVLRRFRREREIQAALTHPNIATLLDAGVTGDGVPYLVLEYVDGMPLDAYCQANRLSLEARLDLVRQVIQAVQHAHRQLVVHRDLKPGNILVTPDGVVKLLDFGISKLLDQSAYTTTEGPSGFTTAYASPEQLRGEPISTATDVYALGVILFRLLAGRHPFELDLASPAAVWKSICDEPPPPPSAVATVEAARAMGFGSLERLRKILRGELDAIMLMALRKEPARRYSTADALGEDLLAYLKGLPVQARPDSRGYRFRKLVARNRLAAAALGTAFLAMGGGTALALWQAGKAKTMATEADRERRTAEQVSTFLQGMFLSADASWRGQGAGPGPNATVLEVVDAAAQRVDRDLAGQPAVAEALHRILVSIYRALGQAQKGETSARSVLAYQRARHAPPVELASSLTHLATNHYIAGRLDSALALLRDAYALYGEAGYPKTEEFGVSLNQLGLVLLASGRPTDAESYLTRAVALRRELKGEDAVVGIGLNNLGLIRDALGDLDGAEVLYRQANQVFLGLEGREYFERGIPLSNLGVALLLENRLDEAEQVTREALALFERTIGADHPSFGLVMFNLARIQLAAGRAGPALATHRDGAKRLSHLAPSHPDVARGETYEAAILLELGRLEAAERLARRALGTRVAAYTRGDWRIAETEEVLGRVLLQLGKTDEARDLLERSYQEFRATMGPQHPRTVAVERELSPDR
jgi:serine/threonine-protein kinase